MYTESLSVRNSKIFITGGAGFIATRLAYLLSDASNEIILYDNLHNNAFKNTELHRFKNIRFIQGDVLNVEQLNSAIDDDVNYIIHCAAIAGVSTVIENPTLTLRVNIQGVFNVLDRAIKLKNLKRIVDFSTSEVYGQFAFNVNEKMISPTVYIEEARWTYAISKLAGEFIAYANHVEHSLPTVTVRPFNIYGPNQVGVGAIHNMVQAAIHDRDIVVHNDGTQIRSWCYVDDFVHAVILTLINNTAIGKTHNIGNPRSSLTTTHLAELIKSLTNSKSNIIYKTTDYQDVQVRIPDIKAVCNDLNFQPEIDLQQGLIKTIQWYKNAQLPKHENATCL